MDGLLSSILEIKDYLGSEKPDVFCMTETRLKEEINVKFQQERFKLWRRDRKGGGEGVLVMVKEDTVVEAVQYGNGMAEVISITIQTNERDRRKIIVTYMPPRTNTWKLEEYKAMQREVLKWLADMMRKPWRTHWTNGRKISLDSEERMNHQR